MTVLYLDNPRFKKAIIYSVAAHMSLFLILLLSPLFPHFSNKKTIFYVDYVMGGGSGGGGGSPGASLQPAAEEVADTAAPAGQTLKDLTIPENLEQNVPKLRHPVEHPKKEPKGKLQKKAAIQKPAGQTSKKTGSNVQAGGGSGVRIGGIGAGTGEGFGAGSGLGNFPYAFYVRAVHDRIASHWFSSRLRAGITGQFETVLRFRIYRDGRQSQPEVLQSSGIRALDLSAIRAVQDARFPPLPRGYEDEYLIIQLIFEHKQ